MSEKKVSGRENLSCKRPIWGVVVVFESVFGYPNENSC